MKHESLKMNLQSLKKQLNDEKVQLIKGKITKSDITFYENKPNLKNIKIGVNTFETGKYEILPAWWSKKQTQYKPKANPITEMQKMGLSCYLTNEYRKRASRRVKKQTRFEPNSNPITPTVNYIDETGFVI